MAAGKAKPKKQNGKDHPLIQDSGFSCPGANIRLFLFSFRFSATLFHLAGQIPSVHHITDHNPEERVLVSRVLHGDKAAFGIIIKNTEKLVAGIVFKMIPVAEDRKDLAQDIYLKTFHYLPGFKFQSKLSTWVAQIAYNSCISWIEKKKPILPGNIVLEDFYEETEYSEYPGTTANPDSENQLSNKELGGILQKEIERLPAIYKTLITLFHQEAMHYDELSQITGLPSGTVKSYLFRARKILKENLLLQYKKEAL